MTDWNLSHDNLAKYASAIDAAESGESQWELFLRLHLKSMAATMPAELLVSVSKIILEYRRNELADEARSN